MNATASPKPPIILATPLDVEESRAQRLQRQQTRFRDRGGIFVPTNRTTLVDILLGRASPLKGPCRSASVSPSRVNKEKYSSGNEVSNPALRRSPRKQSQKIHDVVTREQLPAMNDHPGSERGKPIKKATSSKTSKLRPQKKAKVPLNRPTKPRGGAPVVDHSVVDKATEKAGKRTVDTSKKKTLKVLIKKIIPNADDHSGDLPLVKPKPKGSKTKAQEVDGAKETSKTRRYKPAAETSAAVTSPTRLERTKKAEDNIACMPTKERAEKVKKSAPHLATTSKTSGAETASSQSPEEEEHNLKKNGPPSSQVVKKASLLKDHLVDGRPAKSLNASDDDGDDDIPPIKSKSTNSQEIDGAKPLLKPTKITELVYSELSKDKSVDEVACKPTKKLTANKVKASAAPSMETESSSRRRGKGSSNVDVLEDEEHNLGKGDTAPSKGTPDAVETSKGEKRASASIAQESPQPGRKRNKSGTTETEISLSHQNSNSSDETALVTSKKRRRNSEDAESGVEDSVDNGIKRKKRSGPPESGQTPKITFEKDVAKRLSKTKATKSSHKRKKQSSDNAPPASKRKENIRMPKSSKKVTSNSGPPKSVLQRIKDSLAAEVVDNEPDPIDFLS